MYVNFMLLVSGVNADLFKDGIVQIQKGNHQKASQLWDKACSMGNTVACYNLGVICTKGDGIVQDYKKASELYTKACQAGQDKGCQYHDKLDKQGVK